MPFSINIFDVVDIFLVAFLLYQFYRLIRGTPAMSIFIAVFIIYLFWLLVKVLNLELMSSLLGQVIGVGLLALIVVFQQEIRRFLIATGNRYITNDFFRRLNILSYKNGKNDNPRNTEEIIRAAESLSGKKTGALIVIGRSGSLEPWSEGGEKINAVISSPLIETIFYRNTPLHDGAILIQNGRILSARCPLPITDQTNISPAYGMRHRAAIGMSESTDALVIVVSEETGEISVADSGVLYSNITTGELRRRLAGEKI
ncbi:MAG: TIGR00159 family protein [Bacteroidales bacterium]|nr:TIGR00159 family protein [Bacteroidales bacterium]